MLKTGVSNGRATTYAAAIDRAEKRMGYLQKKVKDWEKSICTSECKLSRNYFRYAAPATVFHPSEPKLTFQEHYHTFH